MGMVKINYLHEKNKENVSVVTSFFVLFFKNLLGHPSYFNDYLKFPGGLLRVPVSEPRPETSPASSSSLRAWSSSSRGGGQM